MEIEQEQHQKHNLAPLNVTLQAQKSNLSIDTWTNQSSVLSDGSIYTILINSTSLPTDPSNLEPVRDLDTSDSNLQRDVRQPERSMTKDEENGNSLVHQSEKQLAREPKLTSKSQLFLKKIKSKRKLKFLKDYQQQKLSSPVNRANDTSASASDNHEEWIDYDASTKVEAPEVSTRTTSRPTRAPQSTRTTRLPREAGRSTGQPAALQVKEESSEAKEDEQPVVSKSVTSTTTVGDGKKRAKVSSKSASLPAGLRRRIIEQFIKNGGDPQNIVVSDSTITTTSQSKKKTITTVYKIVPNSSPSGKRQRTKIKVIKPAVLDSDEFDGGKLSGFGESKDELPFNQPPKGDTLSQLLGQPKRVKSDKMRGRRLKKIMVTRTEMPHKMFLDDEMAGPAEGDDKVGGKGEQELGEFYQGPHETIFGLNENSDQFDELQKNAVLELDKMTDPAVSSKGHHKLSLEVGQVGGGHLDSDGVGMKGVGLVKEKFPSSGGQNKYEFMDKHQASELPPSKSTNSLLSEFKELKESAKVANKKESQHQFGTKVATPSQNKTKKKVGESAAEQRSQVAPDGKQDDERSSGAPQDKSNGPGKSSSTSSEPSSSRRAKATLSGKQAKSNPQVAKSNRSSSSSSRRQSSPASPQSSPPSAPATTSSSGTGATSTTSTSTTSTTTSTTTTTRAPKQSPADSRRQKSSSNNNDKQYAAEELASTLGNTTLSQPISAGAKTHNIMMLIDFGPTNGQRGQVLGEARLRKSQPQVEQDDSIEAQPVGVSNSRQPQRAASSRRPKQSAGFVPMQSYSNTWQPVGVRGETPASGSMAQQVRPLSRPAPTVNVQIYNSAPSGPQASLSEFGGEGSAFGLDESLAGQVMDEQQLYESAASSNELGGLRLPAMHQQLELQSSQLAPSIILPGESASTNQLVSRVIDELAMASEQPGGQRHLGQGQPLYPMTTSVGDSSSLEDEEDADADELLDLGERAASLEQQVQLTSRQPQASSLELAGLPAGGRFGSRQAGDRLMALASR